MNKKSIGAKRKQVLVADCALCKPARERVLWRDALCRIVLVDDPDYIGYCRVIWNSHVKEMTDLSSAQRAHCMRIVFIVERILRDLLAPDKINLACFGNMAPHLHWHIIPRHTRDAHFPNPVWGKRQRGRRTISASKPAAGMHKLISRQLETLL